MGVIATPFPAILNFIKTNGKVGFLMGVGDTISQKFIENQDWDVLRTIRYGSVGMFYLGPILGKWYQFLERRIPKNPKNFRAVKKTLYDQLLFAPIFTLSLMGVFGVVNGDDETKFKSRFTEDYPHVMKMNYLFWPPAQVINFAVIPTSYQVLYVQIVAIVWNIILAKIINA